MMIGMVAAACGRSSRAEAGIDVVTFFREPANTRRIANPVSFADGTRVSDVEIEPAVAVPGEPLRVAWTLSGATEATRLHLGVLPPRTGAWPGLRIRGDRTRPQDDRARWFARTVDEGRMGVVATVPAGWHPHVAMVVLELGDDAGDRVQATGGPRTHDGLAVLAAVPVATRPTSVRAPLVRRPPTIDGRLDDEAWRGAGLELVHSLDGEPFDGDPTRIWIAWDRAALYVAADLPDRDIFTTYTGHDDPLYRQEAFEIFVAADGDGRNYLEYQVSARNVTFDAHFERHRRGDEAWDSRWTTAVEVRGTLENREDHDEGWSVELAIPWNEVCERTGIVCPPSPGAGLRINVFRLERPPAARPYGLALSPTRRPDFHAWENAAELVLEP
jgi:hypothetical protein